MGRHILVWHILHSWFYSYTAVLAKYKQTDIQKTKLGPIYCVESIGIQARIRRSSTAHHSYYTFWAIPAVDRHKLLKNVKLLIKKGMISYQSESASAERKMLLSDGHVSESSVPMVTTWVSVSSTVFFTKSYPYIFFACYLKIFLICQRQCRDSSLAAHLAVLISIPGQSMWDLWWT